MVDHSRYYIDVVITELGAEPWRLSCIYGEAQVAERHKTWGALRSLALQSSLPWVVAGDFNEVLFHSEYEGVGQRSQAQLDSFREALDVCGLADIGHTGSA